MVCPGMTGLVYDINDLGNFQITCTGGYILLCLDSHDPCVLVSPTSLPNAATAGARSCFPMTTVTSPVLCSAHTSKNTTGMSCLVLHDHPCASGCRSGRSTRLATCVQASAYAVCPAGESVAWLEGHLWHGRCFSNPLDDVSLWATIRSVERNPARAPSRSVRL